METFGRHKPLHSPETGGHDGHTPRRENLEKEKERISLSTYGTGHRFEERTDGIAQVSSGVGSYPQRQEFSQAVFKFAQYGKILSLSESSVHEPAARKYIVVDPVTNTVSANFIARLGGLPTDPRPHFATRNFIAKSDPSARPDTFYALAADSTLFFPTVIGTPNTREAPNVVEKKDRAISAQEQSAESVADIMTFLTRKDPKGIDRAFAPRFSSRDEFYRAVAYCLEKCPIEYPLVVVDAIPNEPFNPDSREYKETGNARYLIWLQ